jgi:hypothetical protein
MGSTFRIRARLFARLAAPLFLAAALSACSSIPDWVDPTTWMGGNSQASTDQTSDTGTAQPSGGDQQASGGQATNSDKTPDIANIPPKPAPPSTSDEQKEVANSLVSDRAQANYSADALRGGTEAAAAPPPAAAPSVPSDSATAGASPSAEAAATPPASEAPAATPAAADQAQAAAAPDSASPSPAGGETASNPSVASPSTPPASPDTTASTAETAAPQAAENSALMAGTAAPAGAGEAGQAGNAAPAAPANQVASTDTASTSAPAAAPMAPETAAAPMTPAPQGAPDMQATFAPSKAPALDPSVAQFVPGQILSRYQETAAAAAVPGVSPSAASPGHHHRKKAKTSQIARHHRHLASISQPVMHRHLAAVSDSGEALIAASYSPTGALDRKGIGRAASDDSDNNSVSAVFAPAEQAAVAIVSFPREATILDASARSRIELAARTFAARGGIGFLRVVGRSSAAAPDLPRTARLEYNFERSEAQATAVARELIRDGVPAQRVLVEAVGDSPPTDPEVVQGDRSAEIFLQS